MQSIGWRHTLLASIACLGPAAAAGDSVAFKIGAYAGFAGKDGKIIGVDDSPEKIGALLTAAGAPSDPLDLSIQPLRVQAGHRTQLFDTGAGAIMGEASGELTASLALAKGDPAKVTDIFITHAPGHHVGELIRAEGQLALVNTTIHLSKPQWAWHQALTPEDPAKFGIPRQRWSRP